VFLFKYALAGASRQSVSLYILELLIQVKQE